MNIQSVQNLLLQNFTPGTAEFDGASQLLGLMRDHLDVQEFMKIHGKPIPLETPSGEMLDL